MKNMNHKYMHVTITIAAIWLIAIGLGSDATSCCGTIARARSPFLSGAALMPANDHCQTSSRHVHGPHGAAVDGRWSAFHSSNKKNTCCPALPCDPTVFIAFIGQPPPSSPPLSSTGNAYTTIGNKACIPLFNKEPRHSHTIPIYLLTQKIIC